MTGSDTDEGTDGHDDAHTDTDADADGGGNGDGDRSLDLEGFQSVVQSVGRPVVTASEAARVLGWSQREAADALDALATAGRAERADVADDPTVWYTTDFAALADREHAVVFPDRREVVIEHPEQFTRAQLAQFAHLVDRSDDAYLYRVREEDVWHAPYDDLEDLLGTVRDVLDGRYPSLESWMESQWGRARKFALVTQDDYTVLEAASPDLLGNVALGKLEEGDHYRARIDDAQLWVTEGAEGEIKRILYEAGYPVSDERDLEPGDPLDVELHLELRDYQRNWVDRFGERGAGVFVGPPGSGKTVAALGAMAEVGGETLVLVPSRELATQWVEAITTHTSLEPEQVGQYHGGAKEIRPVTVATYRTAGMDRHRHLFEDRRWGLITYDECLSGSTIIETQHGRTTFGELDDQLDLDDGWNSGSDLTVRTFDPTKQEYEWTNVTGIYRTEGEVQRIETSLGHVLEATPGHTHLVFDPATGEVTEQVGVEKDDYLVRPQQQVAADPAVHSAASRALALAELLGWFIGDGHMNQYGHGKFSFARHAEEQIGIIATLCERLGVEFSTFENSRGDLTLYVSQLDRVLGLSESGDKTTTVSVPSEAYEWSRERTARLLRGLFDAEGSVDKKGRIQFNSVSEALVDDVVILLQRLGLPSRRLEIPRDDSDHSTVHRLTIPSFYGPQFEERVGFELIHKAERLQNGASPAMGLPVGPLLEELKEAGSLTNEQIATMAGVSRQTIGDVIRDGRFLGQHNLSRLAEGLADRVAESPDPESGRERYNVTYEELAEDTNTPPMTVYNRFQRGESRTLAAVDSIIKRRQSALKPYIEKLDRLRGCTIARVEDVKTLGKQPTFDLETETHTFIADGFLTHNCHHIPARVYRRSADLQAKHRLGLSATPIRESDDEQEIFTLIGPPIGTDWAALFDAGFVAEPEVEIRYVPWVSEMDRNEYASADGNERQQIAASNPAKLPVVERLLERHTGQKTLIFVDWLDQGRALSETLGIPFVSGETRHAERRRLFDAFRAGERETLLISRVGDEGIDLPDAEVAIVASGLGGSRRQGSQRAGRTMRPVGRALVYMLATRGTVEEEFVRRQTRHLAGKGVRVTEADADIDIDIDVDADADAGSER